MMRKVVIIAIAYLAIDILFTAAQGSYQPAYAIENVEATPKVDTMEIFFQNYSQEAQLYLDRDVFEGTPMTGDMMAECAKETYDSTGVIVPLELALSQAQWESGMGRKGKSAKNNPYNVGEWDRGTMMKFKSTKQGVQAYYNLMARDYLAEKSVDQLLTNFVNTTGHRYASSTSYEAHIGGTYKTIRNWIDEQSDSTQTNS